MEKQEEPCLTCDRIFRVLAFIKHLVGERFSFTDLHRPVTQRGQTHFTIIQGTTLN